MRQVICAGAGGPDVLQVIDASVPEPGAGQVLIQVAFAGINRPDIVQRQGLYPPPLGASSVLGLEVSGQIVAIGDQVTGFVEGDYVCALVNGGGYAEFAIAEARHCLPIPVNLTLKEAATIPEAAFTVWHNVFQRGALKAGQSLLVHGGAGGIGSFAVQLASARGSRVFATGGGETKCKAIQAFGAERAIDYFSEDFVDVCRSLTNGQGVNVVLDIVGGDYLQRNLRVCAPDGNLISISFLHGSRVNIDLMPLMVKRITWGGSTMRAQSDHIKARIADELRLEVWPLFGCGLLRPHIHAEYPLTNVADAHKDMERGEHIGKLVLSLR